MADLFGTLGMVVQYVDDLCAPGGGVLPDVVQSIRTISDTNSRARSSSSGTAASDIGEVTEDSPQAVRRETSPESNSTGEGFSEEEGEQDWGCACAEEGRECGIGSGCDCVEDYVRPIAYLCPFAQAGAT